MKKIIILIFSSLIFNLSHAQKQIAIADISKYFGHLVTVCDSVYSIKFLPHLTFVNVGGDYPNQKITLVFYKHDLYLLNIEPDKLYQGKRICVKGKVIQYEGKPQIVIKSLKQIQIKD